MQRHPAFAIPLGTGDLGTAEAAGELHPNTFSTGFHGVLHGALHGAAEHHPALKLPGDVFANQTSVQIRLAHLFNIDVHRNAHLGGHVAAQTFNVLALLTDHNARTRRGDRNAHVF